MSKTEDTLVEVRDWRVEKLGSFRTEASLSSGQFNYESSDFYE